MLDRDTLLICEHCDSVFRKPTIDRSEIAHCTCCGAVLCRGSGLSTRDLLALTAAAAILLAIAAVSPVIRIDVGGLHNDVTLLTAIASLWRGYARIVALLAGLTMLAVPMLQIVLLGWVLLFAEIGRRAPGFAACVHTLHRIAPWSMSEVFLIGVLVAIIKLAGMLHVVPGVGAYATAAFAVLIVVIGKRDVRMLWDSLPERR